MQEKKALKEEKLKQEEKYMWAIVDGVKEKVTSSNIIIIYIFFWRGVGGRVWFGIVFEDCGCYPFFPIS